MVLSISATRSTLWDQIRYSGDPSQFIWVLPIRSARDVEVGLADNAFVDALDQVSAPVIQGLAFCNRATGMSGGLSGGSSGSAGCGAPFSFNPSMMRGSDGSSLSGSGARVVGPYSAQVVSSRTTPLAQWLPREGLMVPANTLAAIEHYDSLSFDYIVLRMRPGAGVRQIQPVRITYPGATMALPLRMIVAGTADSVGLELLVLSTSRVEPVNFAASAIGDGLLQFDFATMRSNYAQLLAERLDGRTSNWLIESAAPIVPNNFSFFASGVSATTSANSLSLDRMTMPVAPSNDAGSDASAVWPPQDPDMHGPSDVLSPPNDSPSEPEDALNPPEQDGAISPDPDAMAQDAETQDAETQDDSAVLEAQDAPSPAPEYDVPDPAPMMRRDPFVDMRYAFGDFRGAPIVLTRLRARLAALALDRDLQLQMTNGAMIPVLRETSNVLNVPCTAMPMTFATTPTPRGGCGCRAPAQSAQRWFTPMTLLAAGSVLLARRALRRRSTK
jgi:hypothetical protein